MPLLRRRISTEIRLRFSVRILAKKYPEQYGSIRNEKGGRYDEADIENTRRSHRCGAYVACLDLLRPAVLFRFHTRPCRNGPWHPRRIGSDYRSGYEWDYRTSYGVSRQPVWNPDGGGVPDRQDTGFAVRNSGSGLRLKTLYDVVQVIR